MSIYGRKKNELVNYKKSDKCIVDSAFAFASASASASKKSGVKSFRLQNAAHNDEINCEFL